MNYLYLYMYGEIKIFINLVDFFGLVFVDYLG